MNFGFKKYSQLINNWINGNRTVTYLNDMEISENINFIDFDESTGILRLYNVEGEIYNRIIDINLADVETLMFYISTIDDGYVLSTYQDKYNTSERSNKNQMNCLIIKNDENKFSYEIKLRSDEQEDYEK